MSQDHAVKSSTWPSWALPAATLAVILLLHLVVGWWAGVLVMAGWGYLRPQRAWLFGGLFVLAAWTVLLLTTALMNVHGFLAFLPAMGALVGVPGFVVALVSLFLGFLTGAAAAFTGSGVRMAVKPQ